MNNQIKINDSLKTYDIVNQNNKLLGQFSFNPSDTNIVKRYKEVVEHLDKLEFATDEDTAKSLKNIEDAICKEINYLLASDDAAEAFFSIMGALSPLESGKFYVETVLEAIGQAIQAETGERVKKINSKIKKHTSKYYD